MTTIKLWTGDAARTACIVADWSFRHSSRSSSGQSEGAARGLSLPPRILAPTSMFNLSTSQPVDCKIVQKVHKNAISSISAGGGTPLPTSLAAEIETNHPSLTQPPHHFKHCMAGSPSCTHRHKCGGLPLTTWTQRSYIDSWVAVLGHTTAHSRRSFRHCSRPWLIQ